MTPGMVSVLAVAMALTTHGSMTSLTTQGVPFGVGERLTYDV